MNAALNKMFSRNLRGAGAPVIFEYAILTLLNKADRMHEVGQVVNNDVVGALLLEDDGAKDSALDEDESGDDDEDGVEAHGAAVEKAQVVDEPPQTAR